MNLTNFHLLLFIKFLLLIDDGFVSSFFHFIRPVEQKFTSRINSFKENPSQLQKIFDRIARVDEVDVVKEASRQLRRTVYTTSDWRAHRSSNRYINQLLNMPQSNIIRSLSYQVLGVTLFTSLLVIYNCIVTRYSWTIFGISPILSFPPLPFSLTANSLGLLLVFRTNAAYSRWKDARIAWATISSKSFSLIRQAMSWFPEKDKNLKSDLVRYMVAFVRTLTWKLRYPKSETKLRGSLNDILSANEIDEIMLSKSRVHRISSKLTELVRKANLLPNVQCHVDKGLCDLMDSVCQCERIFTTPIPLIYTRHTTRFLLLWLLTVPMALYHEFSKKPWAIIPICFLNAVFLFGIEELGVQIEEPFSILALDHFCDEIQLVGEDALSFVNQTNSSSSASSSSSNQTISNATETVSSASTSGTVTIATATAIAAAAAAATTTTTPAVLPGGLPITPTASGTVATVSIPPAATAATASPIVIPIPAASPIIA